jgi:hypothetical protein
METLFYNSKNIVGIGAVGIGTNSPVTSLDVNASGSTYTTIPLHLVYPGAQDTFISFEQTGSTAFGIGLRSGALGGRFAFVGNFYPGGPGGTEIACLTQGGNFGIGTTNPATALDAYTGTINAASVTVTNIYASNAITTTNLFANTLTLSNATSTVAVTGNIYASNAITATNLFANTLTLSNATSRINVTGNIYASNALTTTNILATSVTFSAAPVAAANVLTVINTTTTGNVAQFSTSAGAAMIIKGSRNVGIGTTNPATALDIYTGTMNAAAVTATTVTAGSGGAQIGTKGTGITNIITGAYSCTGVSVGAGALSFTVPIGQTLAGTNYKVFMTLTSGGLSTFAVGLAGALTTTSFDARIQMISGAGSTPSIQWLLIDLN